MQRCEGCWNEVPLFMAIDFDNLGVMGKTKVFGFFDRREKCGGTRYETLRHNTDKHFWHVNTRDARENSRYMEDFT
jgi:hypothetical protein